MRKIIVTGASGGLGLSIVKKLLSCGYDICAVGHNKENLEKTFAEVDGVSTYACDLSNDAELTDVMKTLLSAEGPVGGLVHCAGINKYVPLHMVKRKNIEEIFSIHVFAALSMCSMLSKKGYTEEGASIVLLSSLAAHEGTSGNSIYAAAKASLEGFVHSSAHDFADRGIRINAIVPGDVDSGMFRSFISRLTEEQKIARLEKYPLGFGESEDIANFVAFLLGSDSKWMTGQCYTIDGGHSVQRV